MKTRSEGSTGSTGVFYHLSPSGTHAWEYLFANPAVQQRSSSILLNQGEKKVQIRCNKGAKDQLQSTCITIPLSSTAWSQEKLPRADLSPMGKWKHVSEHVASQLSKILAGNPFLSHLIQNTEACCLTAEWDQLKLYQNIGNQKLFF